MPRRLFPRVPTATALFGLTFLLAGPAELPVAAPAQAQQREQVAAVQVVGSWVAPIVAGDAKVKTVIGNDEPVPLTLTGARTEGAARVMMVHHGQPVDRVVIAPGDTLGPYGFYLLLDDVTEPLREGRTLPLDLTFADRAPLRLEVRVGAAVPAG